MAYDGSPPRTLEDVGKLIESIYEWALDTDRYEDLLRHIAGALGGRTGLLALNAAGTANLNAMESIGFDPERLNVWQGEFDGFEPFTQRRGPIPAGTAILSSEILGEQEFHSMPVYRPLFRLLDIEHFLAISLFNGPGGMGVVAAQRGLKDGPFPAESAQAARIIAPHLALMTKIQSRLSRLEQVEISTNSALDLLPYAVFVLEEAGRVTWQNRSAERVVARNDGLTIRLGRLEARAPSAQALRLATRNALGLGGRPRVGSHLPVLRTSPARPYHVLITPIAARKSELDFAFLGRRASALVIVSDPESPPRLAADVLQRLFGLTPALARLASAIAAGKTVQEYAEAHGVTKDTARRQLKDLMARTGTRRQAELVRLLLSGVATLHAEATPFNPDVTK
jgi:DNA-binding CsgD family transcriptional regulator